MYCHNNGPSWFDLFAFLAGCLFGLLILHVLFTWLFTCRR